MKFRHIVAEFVSADRHTLRSQ